MKNNIYDIISLEIPKLIENEENWKNFLDTSSRIYKYSFKSQALIHIQRPNAVACATMDIWNNQMHRWIKKGSRSIVTIDNNNNISYLFDYADTKPVNEYSKEVDFWNTKGLETKIAKILDEQDFTTAIEKEINKSYEKIPTILNNNDNAILIDLIKRSIEYTVKSRLSIPVNDINFDNITSISTPNDIYALGVPTSILSKEILLNIENITKKERIFENELHATQRIHDTSSIETEHTTEQIWESETQISSGYQSDIRMSDDNVRGNEQSFDRNTRASFSEGNSLNQSDDDSFISNGGTEGEKSNGMGRTDEQYSEVSRGNSIEGTDLYLDKILSEEQQILKIEEQQIYDTEIDKILCMGSGFAGGKFRILEFFSQGNIDIKKKADFLKNEYGIGGVSPALPNIRENYDGKGIRLEKGSALNPSASILLKWQDVAKRITKLVENNSYLNENEIEKYKNSILNKENKDEKPSYFSLGDTVYIGNVKYELLEFDENNVTLVDSEFPLSHLDLSIDEFDKKINENPLNNKILPHIETKTDDKKFYEKSNPEELITHEMLNRVPPFYGQEDISLENQIVHAAYFIPLRSNWTWYMTEYDIKSNTAYGLVAGDFPEWGYFSLDELKELNAQRLLLEDFPKSFKELKDTELKKQLTAEEIDSLFLGKLNDNVKNDIVAETNHTVNADIVGTDREIKPIEEKQNEDVIDYSYYKNKQVVIDDSDFLIESVDEKSGKVSMMDMTFYKQNGFPIFRSEPISYIENILTQQEQEHENAPINNSPKSKLQFKIVDNELGIGTVSERYNNNINAIKTLRNIENEQRLASIEEQEILSKYVGWGGLDKYFNPDNNNYLELKTLLTDDEYSSARESTLTSFYTPPIVIKSIYKALENMNFSTGNILEPSCGTGNFMGLLPSSMNTSKFYGVELDSISGRIAQQLYQKSNIAIQGFEDTSFPDNFFDCAIGNVPFGQFKVSDKKYDKHNFLIHDYFFAKTLDKVRPGGIVAFITSKGTMDKENPKVRKYIAQRADLIGAIRLPNNTFKAAAGTEVTSDIIFLQKRDRLLDIEPEWVNINFDENGVKMNQYFIDNPNMVLGNMEMISGPYGLESACLPNEEKQTLDEQLEEAIKNIKAEITQVEHEDLPIDDESIPADPTVKNFSYAIIENKIYYRENSIMTPVDVSNTVENRIKDMIILRDCVRTLIEYQTEDYPEQEIKKQQEKLNIIYDSFTTKHGLINSKSNSSAFKEDSSYFLLSSLEILDDEGNFLRKADIFNKRTIRKKVIIDRVDTSSEALALSIGEKAKVDISYMENLTGKTEEEIYSDLKGVIFLNPLFSNDDENNNEKYLTADEYLSGNVRKKLSIAEKSAELSPDKFEINVEALKKVQPIDLTANEISVKLGSTWIPAEIVSDFMFDLLDTPYYAKSHINVNFFDFTSEWYIEGKSYDKSNIKASNTYGTNRISAYKIIEDTLNLKDVRIFDYFETEDGKKKAVLNKEETAIAQSKQELIKNAFVEWVWKEPTRRTNLCKIYNEKFNSIRPREYDGSHLNFVGINPEITLRKHQVNAIAHILYGGNTLLAHVVGAGKTFEMIAAAQESKRLGLCQKPLFVVPNHLTEQWASEYLQLYPSANILVATKKDFETKNRKKFCGKIATGEYDAIIIGHSQFEKIPMSIERQKDILEKQIEEITNGIMELKVKSGQNLSIKQLEKTKKSIKQKLDKLNDQSRKDDVITFEELGVDRIFVDEAHNYKNLAAFTKMRNVAGVSQTEAMKSSDLYMKCRYLDEITNGKGIIFATGTPISNSMVEMYTMQKYLQFNKLKSNNLLHFDAWASTFGETVTAIELAPEGTGYRAKTRFAKFHNLPELMAMFKETADIQTADMLKLPVPKANYHNIVLKPSEQQVDMVKALSKRAEDVRNKVVTSDEDNMLLITNDGRKLALDQRLINDMLPDNPNGKLQACADNVYNIYQNNMETQATQLIFCDLSTPNKDHFNVYDDIKEKLKLKGIPDDEIAFIHSANSEAQKKELFGKVRSGQIRVLIGSTAKMGAGTNVQDKLIALHHLDCPWRPSDLQQREGRIIRQGNKNSEVDIYNYVTENTFDSYLYQMVENKQKFIGQIMTSKSPVRSAEDIDETALSYAEIKALCTGNPLIKEKMDLDIEVQKLKLLKSNYLSEKYSLEDKITRELPMRINSYKERINGLEYDAEYLKEHTLPSNSDFYPMTINGTTYTNKKEAGNQILLFCKNMTKTNEVEIGEYKGFKLSVSLDVFNGAFVLSLKNKLTYNVTLGNDIFGNIQRIDNVLNNISNQINTEKTKLENCYKQLDNAKIELDKPFAKEKEFNEKMSRLNELNILLNLDKTDNNLENDEAPKSSLDDLLKDGKSRCENESSINSTNRDNEISL